ncbi:MAG: hypothetical protein JWP12_1704 [Bacteroidetes bacterium]|nr:hypothetical protein [Bacteroidota bacterium]
MINLLKKAGVSLALIFIATSGFAQDAAQTATNNAPVEMATGLYQSGKIYVVVIVVAVILIGIIGYLTMLDRKISKLEKEIENK